MSVYEPTDRASLREAVGRIRWYHSIDLGFGVVTPGFTQPTDTLSRLNLPDSLAGKSVLDIGAWDGFYSFEAERRGASRVLATDHHCWSGQGWGTKAGFDLARRALRSNVDAQDIDVLELSPETVGVFDVTLFLGVLYHMRYPLLALERVASVTGDLLVLETETAHPVTTRPVVRYFLEGDDWCAPNRSWLISALRDVGFSEVREAWHIGPISRMARAARRIAKNRSNLSSAFGRGRMVLHATR